MVFEPVQESAEYQPPEVQGTSLSLLLGRAPSPEAMVGQCARCKAAGREATGAYWMVCEDGRPTVGLRLMRLRRKNAADGHLWTGSKVLI